MVNACNQLILWNQGHTVAWDVDGNHNPYACVDLDPCELYASCPIVEDPLKEDM